MALPGGSQLGTGPCPSLRLPEPPERRLQRSGSAGRMHTHPWSLLFWNRARQRMGIPFPFPSSALGSPQLCHTSAVCCGLLLWGAQHCSQGHVILTRTILRAGGAPEAAGSSSRRKGCSRKISAWSHDALCQVIISSLTQHQFSWWDLLAVFHMAVEEDQGDQIYWVS